MTIPETSFERDFAAFHFKDQQAVLAMQDQEVGLALARRRVEVIARRIDPGERVHDDVTARQALEHRARDVGLRAMFHCCRINRRDKEGHQLTALTKTAMGSTALAGMTSSLAHSICCAAAR